MKVFLDTNVRIDFVCCERAKMPINMLRKKIDALREYVHVSDVISEDIYQSYANDWEDFEDGVQYYSAIRAGSDYIATSNVEDFGLSIIPVCTPSEFIKTFRE